MSAGNHGATVSRRLVSHRLRAMVRRAVAFSLYYSGLLWLHARYKLRGRAVVLMYHRVLPPDADSCSTDGIVVTPATFARHMAFLSRHFRPLSSGQFRACLDAGRLPDRACLVTFDDGWADNEQFALPVLERFQVPAIMFLATGFVGGSRPFWQEELARLLVEAHRGRPADRGVLNEFGLLTGQDATEVELRRAARDVVTRLKSASDDDVDALRCRLSPPDGSANRHTRRYGDDSFLDWDAARRLATHPLIAVASHAHSHVPLTRLGRHGAQLDLLRSREEFAAQGLPTTEACAYPNGDHDSDTIAAAAEAGFSMAFTTVPGHVGAADDRLRIRRINIHETATATRPEFLCRLLGLF